ncbi:hypothetical protein ZIOFF_052997 [Zingiber officinale]|uniref:Uncharacterized protein n=2 Tax=Zingiber officinale TaxID=94328 RepID=A0A8J5FBT9_ZINOF|nr:hypothetical protein ZIOFF_052997 [Zingiber officinale]
MLVAALFFHILGFTLEGMELRTGRNSAAKALWSQLRVALFVMRKSLAWKQQQLLLEIKLLGESLGDFLYRRRPERPLYGLREHEFSCSNTPNHPLSYGRRYKAGKRRHGYLLPCLHGAVAVAEPEAYCRHASPRRAAVKSVLFSPTAFAVRISNYSSDDEYLGQSAAKVDDEAEEFIRKFYEQLRQQSRMPLLHCQEKELARGL